MQIATPTPAAAPAGAPECLNCAVPLLGSFCTSCGQRAATLERVTFRALWTDFRVAQLGLDRGFFVTLRDVVVRPGVVALAFAEGRRRRYVHPVAFLFLAYGLYAVSFNLLEEPMLAAMRAVFQEQVTDPSMTPAQRDAMVEGGISATRFSVAYGPYLSIFSVLPFAGLLRMFLPRGGRTVAECAVFALTTEAAFAVVSGLVTNPLVAWTGALGLSPFSFCFYFVFTALGAAVFFDRRPRTVLRALAAQAFALALYLLVIGVASAAYGVAIGARMLG